MKGCELNNTIRSLTLGFLRCRSLHGSLLHGGLRSAVGSWLDDRGFNFVAEEITQPDGALQRDALFTHSDNDTDQEGDPIAKHLK